MHPQAMVALPGVEECALAEPPAQSKQPSFANVDTAGRRIERRPQTARHCPLSRPLTARLTLRYKRPATPSPHKQAPTRPRSLATPQP